MKLPYEEKKIAVCRNYLYFIWLNLSALTGLILTEISIVISVAGELNELPSISQHFLKWLQVMQTRAFSVAYVTSTINGIGHTCRVHNEKGI